MSWLKNLKVRNKLMLGFSLVVILVFVLSVFSYITVQNVDSVYSYLLEMPQKRMTLLLESNTRLSNLRRGTEIMPGYIGNAAKLSEITDEIDQTFESLKNDIVDYKNLVAEDPVMENDEKDALFIKAMDFEALIEQYKTDVSDKISEYARGRNNVAAIKTLEQSDALLDEILAILNELTNHSIQASNTISDDTSADVISNSFILATIAGIIIVLSIIISLLISGIIQRPIERLVDVAKNVAEGNLNVNIQTDSKDEIGILSQSFSAAVANINNIISDIDKMYKRHERGEIQARMNSNAYSGSYKDVTIGINNMVESYIVMLEDIFRVLGDFANGEFESYLHEYKGEKAVVNKEIGKLRNMIKDIVKEIDRVADAGSKGQLSERADTARFRGSWSNILLSLNDVLNEVSKPIKEAQDVMLEMSKGNFDVSVTGNYEGDFKLIKTSLNATVSSISAYIKEIIYILGQMAQGDLTKSIDREYIGQFAYIKNSINKILEALNETIYGIHMASEQVFNGAAQISDSSMTLADASEKQASAIEELNASVDAINSQTQGNTSSAGIANNLSAKSMENAKTGNEEMKEMLTSMNQIKVSSDNISKIIKVIEDIAFQTNLLALNAAVEAARAGAHGKGFAVVAEEVRNLASRSQNAAHETTALIEDSISKVGYGTNIAKATSEALDMIVSNATEVSQIMTKISSSFLGQAEAIAHVNEGLNDISQVVMDNTSTAKQFVDASEDLRSQAEILKQMINFFKLNVSSANKKNKK